MKENKTECVCVCVCVYWSFWGMLRRGVIFAFYPSLFSSFPLPPLSPLCLLSSTPLLSEIRSCCREVVTKQTLATAASCVEWRGGGRPDPQTTASSIRYTQICSTCVFPCERIKVCMRLIWDWDMWLDFEFCLLKHNLPLTPLKDVLWDVKGKLCLCSVNLCYKLLNWEFEIVVNFSAKKPSGHCGSNQVGVAVQLRLWTRILVHCGCICACSKTPGCRAITFWTI